MLTLLEEDFTPPTHSLEIPTRTQVGEIWRVGEDRLLVGDSLNEVQRRRLLGTRTIDMVFTDPPYRFTANTGSTSFFHTKQNKSMGELQEAKLTQFDPQPFLDYLPLLFRVNHHNSMIFTNKDLLPDYLQWAKVAKLSYNVLVWKKNSWMPVGDHHYSDVEYLLYFRRNSVWNNEDVYQGANRSRVLEYKKENNPHPSPKPVALIKNQILLTTHPHQWVFDPYTGSGSTWCACIATKRHFLGAEILPRFADLALSRAEQWSGKEAVRDG